MDLNLCETVRRTGAGRDIACTDDLEKDVQHHSGRPILEAEDSLEEQDNWVTISIAVGLGSKGK